MKRRSFLTMLGAAVAAPAMPAVGQGMGRNLSAAIAAHARKYPLVSVIGISRRVGVPMPEAERLLFDLSRRGLVGPVHSCATGPISAASKVFRPIAPYGIKPVTQRDAAKQGQSLRSEPKRHWNADMKGILRHLHNICDRHGLAVQPRALEAVA